MSSPQYFSDDEWNLLLQAPRQAVIAMSLADKTDPVSFLKEVQAGVRILTDEQQRTDITNDIVRAILASQQEADKASGLQGEELVLKKGFELLGEIYPLKNAEEGLKLSQDILVRATTVLASKVSVVQAEEFKRWLLSIAQRVAETVKEGSLFGLGGEKVSREEASTLKRLEKALEFKL